MSFGFGGWGRNSVLIFSFPYPEKTNNSMEGSGSATIK